MCIPRSGLQLLADTWYDCILATFEEIYEDVTPPTPALGSVPPQAECFGSVLVSWSGSDNLNGTGVASFDVQAQVDAGSWTDWLMATTATSASYSNLAWGHTYSFRVRARDVAGNVSGYTAPGSTQVKDTAPPYEAHSPHCPRPAWPPSPCTGAAATPAPAWPPTMWNTTSAAEPGSPGRPARRAPAAPSSPRPAAVRPDLLFPRPRARPKRQRSAWSATVSTAWPTIHSAARSQRSVMSR